MSEMSAVSCEISAIKIEIEVSETQLQEQTWPESYQITNTEVDSDSATESEVKNEKCETIETEYRGYNISFGCPKCPRHFVKWRLLQCHVRKDHRDLRKNVHGCRICSKSFYLKSLLSIHMNSHIEKVCFECNEVLASSDALKNHVASIHADKIDFVCRICCQVSIDSQDHNVHVCSHPARSRYVCNHCSKCYASFGGLERHSRKHLGIVEGGNCVQYKCLVCSEMFLHEKLLNSHMEIHIGVRPYKCDLCPKKFTTRRNLYQHQTRHFIAVGSRYKCLVCPKTYASKRFLGSHMNMHRGLQPYSRDYCSKTYANIISFYHHRRKHLSLGCSYTNRVQYSKKNHLETLEASTHRHYKCSLCSNTCRSKRGLEFHMNTHIGSRPYKCEQCSKSYTNPRHLAHHRRNHSRPITSKRKIKCSICSKTYCSKKDLASHMNYHSGTRPFACNQCPKKYTSQGSLQRHRLKHIEPIDQSNQCKFQCSICPKKYRERRSLNYHMNVHTGASPFKCSQCSEAFKNPGSLQRHVLVHTNEKFQCTKCEKVFASRIRLRRHTKRTHDISDTYACEKCARTFRNPDVFRNHVESHDRFSTNNKQLKHICTVCKKQHKSKTALEAHMNCHRDERPFKCEVCSKAFVSVISLQNHGLWHSYEKKYECTACDKKFFWDWQRLRHEEIHSKAAKPLKCKWCAHFFSSMAQLTSHVKSKKCRVIVDGQDVDCDGTSEGPTNHRASKNLQKIVNAKQVEAVNHDARNAQDRYRCGECSKEFISKRNLVFHSRKHAQEFAS